METKIKVMKNSNDRKGERGAALVMVLMISFLLLVAATGLLLESSMNTANVTDATSEEQAYYAAESGIQSVVDALRHNPAPNPLIDATKVPYPPDPAADEANQIDYLKATRLATSNATAPNAAACAAANPPLDCVPRLSRWLPYSTAFPDRIVLGNPATYSPLNGFAYSVRVTDPDNTGGVVTYTMSGGIDNGSGSLVSSRTFGTGGNTTTITYTPPAGLQTVNVSSGIGNGSIGSFTMTTTGTGGTIPAMSTTPVRFKLVMAVSQPQNTSVIIRGYVAPTGAALQQQPSGTCSRPAVMYLFDSQNYLAFGSRTSITNGGCMVEETSTKSGPYGTYLGGWMIQSAGSGVAQPLTASITQPEPTRLMIRSTGYGPKGARKELESIIQKNYFNGLGAPSPLLLVGPPCTLVVAFGNCVARPTITSFNFDPGNSTPIIYSGKDTKLKAFLPPIGLTNDPNTAVVRSYITGFNGSVLGSVENVAQELPFWLQTPVNLNNTVQLLKAAAQAAGTYWGPTSSPPNGGAYGDWANATGITFVDKDVQISGDGGGILVVNGELNFKGNYRFNGLVLIIGKDGFLRNGGGNGVLAGNMVVAPYDATSLACTPQTVNCYLSPQYAITGGGNSDLMFNSQNVTNGLSGLGNFVKGVAEK